MGALLAKENIWYVGTQDPNLRVRFKPTEQDLTAAKAVSYTHLTLPTIA